jgi:hypothetical protein
MTPRRVQSLVDLVAGRSVALVGNSQRILQDKPAKQIDSADCVIRINRGLPQIIDPTAVGERTTIWATARFWGDLVIPADCCCVLWMKLTALGNAQFPLMAAACDQTQTPIIRWPQALEDACELFVGAPPGTGIRVLWWLKMCASPRSVSCYGMDCWEEPTHWSGKKNTPNHVPELERQAMLRLL